MKWLIFTAALLAAVAPALAAEPVPESVSGAPLIIDGDTIWIAKAGGGFHKIRLGGIDAPEMRTRDGLYARAVLGGLIATGDGVICEIVEPKRDRYGRLIGRCYAGPESNRIELGRAMVLMGWAWPLPQYAGDRYNAAEIDARLDCRGVWADWPPCE